MTTSTLPPDIFDQTTIISLSAVVVFLASAWALASCVVPASTPTSLRVLFVWHAFDVLIHSILEGSFVYHCLFSWIPDVAGSVGQGGREVGRDVFYPTAKGFIGTEGRIYGSQADATSPFAALWMVYARADWRWAGSDLTVLSLELLTVGIVGPCAALVCYLIAKKDPRASIVMIFVATCELYGGFMTFAPEWLTGNQYLDSSNFMYLWVYLVFFNCLWIVFPLYAVWVSYKDITNAFAVRSAATSARKSK